VKLRFPVRQSFASLLRMLTISIFYFRIEGKSNQKAKSTEDRFPHYGLAPARPIKHLLARAGVSVYDSHCPALLASSNRWLVNVTARFGLLLSTDPNCVELS
jgi:hypothetical protein